MEDYKRELKEQIQSKNNNNLKSNSQSSLPTHDINYNLTHKIDNVQSSLNPNQLNSSVHNPVSDLAFNSE